MKLEQEAQAHVYNKKRQFLEALKEYAAYLEKYYDDNLYGSHELDQARTQLQSSTLWAAEAADMHGIK
jgi:hypothetical protein